ncbi:MAG: hypothetical protein FWE03_02585 [Firmicutes bacterium]|nr:hypothetical protein [Bacillota bacterium]
MKKSVFTGKMLPFLWVHVVYFASILLTANLLMPLGLAYKERYLAKHTIIDGKELKFVGSGTKLLIKKLLISLISPIILGFALGLFFAGQALGESYGLHEYILTALSIFMIVIYIANIMWTYLRLKKWIIKNTQFI